MNVVFPAGIFTFVLKGVLYPVLYKSFKENEQSDNGNLAAYNIVGLLMLHLSNCTGSLPVWPADMPLLIRCLD